MQQWHTIFLLFFLSFLFLDFIYLFLEWGMEKEGEKHQSVVASHMPPTGDLTCNPGMCPDWELNWWPFGSQANTQSTEPHQPGHLFLIYVSGPRHYEDIHTLKQKREFAGNRVNLFLILQFGLWNNQYSIKQILVAGPKQVEF